MKSDSFKLNKRFFLLSAVLVLPAVFVTRVVQRRQDAWERNLSARVRNLLPRPFKTAESQASEAPPQLWSDVPTPVKRYLHLVFSSGGDGGSDGKAVAAVDLEVEPHPLNPASVSLVQRGEFLLQEGFWFPYRATETVTQEGFVWAASMSALDLTSSRCGGGEAGSLLGRASHSTGMLSRWIKTYVEPLLTIWIVDAFCFDEPSFALISWMKGVMAVVDSSPPTPDFARLLEIGEVVRWLAELVMLPVVYLPSKGKVRWAPHPEDPDNKAVLVLNVNQASNLASVRLTATFDSGTGFLSRLQGDRPYLERETKTFRIRSWVGEFDSYRWSGESELWFATEMKAGWMDDSPIPTLSLAARAYQTQVRYQLKS